MTKIAVTRLLLVAILVAVIVVGVVIFNAVQSNDSACDQWPAGSMDRQMCLEVN